MNNTFLNAKSRSRGWHNVAMVTRLGVDYDQLWHYYIIVEHDHCFASFRLPLGNQLLTLCLVQISLTPLR